MGKIGNRELARRRAQVMKQPDLAHYPVPCCLVPVAGGSDPVDVRQITLTPSDPDFGIFSAGTPLALALVDRQVGEKVEIAGTSYIITALEEKEIAI